MSNTKQKCPICDYLNDVSIYVTGQKARCERCKILFEVKRSESFDGREQQFEGKGVDDKNESIQKETLIFSDIPQITGYEIIGIIGKGGMGSVYKARQLSLNRLVAIKVLKSEYASQKDFILRFNREAEVLAKLSHPNIVPIIDKGVQNGLFYFVMEYIDGETLRQKLKNGRLRFDEAIKYTLQILRAISFAHKQNVIHRDLKPENVLIDKNGNVRIADFGLADIVGAQNDYSLTNSGMAMGTAHYMAPEQRRDAKRVDSRADIFSLGITLYEMLSGEVPQGNFKRICQLRNDVNPAIDAVIEKAIASKPTDRYQSSDEMTVAIRAALVENEKKTVLSTDDIADKKEIIEVKSYTDSGRERSLKRYLIFGIISGLIIVIVISLLIWFLR
ncbi:MAG: protein kinase domain-containing protein [Myxococcota bacterium]